MRKPLWSKIITDKYHRAFLQIEYTKCFIWVLLHPSIGLNIFVHLYYIIDIIIYQKKFGTPTASGFYGPKFTFNMYFNGESIQFVFKGNYTWDHISEHVYHAFQYLPWHTIQLTLNLFLRSQWTPKMWLLEIVRRP